MEGILLSSLGDVSLSAAVVLAVVFGLLTPRAQSKAAQQIYEARLRDIIEDRTYWRDLAMKLDEQIAYVIPALQTTLHVVESLPTAANAEDGGTR